MTTHRIGLIQRFICAATIAVAAHTTSAQVISDAEIRAILAERIGTQQPGTGIVVGVIEPAGRRVVAYGTLAKDDPRPIDGDTVFEIGSATKVFTSLLLADMARRGEVSLSDPVAKYLPSSVTVPQRGGRQITLADLATHTSGLPRLPSNLAPKNPADPYADYTVEQLYAFLSTVQLTRDIGSKYEYSNLGAGLLGHVLALRAKTDYATLVRTRILDPLGMKNTAVTLTPAMAKRLAHGHDAAGEPVSGWSLPTLAGAGALHSTASDLLRFLAANLGYTESPLAPAMRSMLAERRDTGVAGLQIALAWHVFVRNGREIVWHNGGTGGYRSWMGFDPKTRTGVVVLTNVSTQTGGDDIGLHLLDPSAPLAKSVKQPPVVKVDPALLERYAGKYRLAPGFVLTVTKRGERMFAQATGQPEFEIFPSSDHEFFLKVVEARITFVTGADGPATSLVLHQNGQDVPGPRIP